MSSHLSDCSERVSCRICSTTPLVNVLNLNDQPLANAYLPEQTKPLSYSAALPAGQNEKDYLLTYPLKLNVCPKCFHLQLSHVVRPEILYKHYLYASGTNQTIAKYFDFLAHKINNEWEDGLKNGRQSAVAGEKSILEIACNDATQLDYFLKLGWKTYGVDPAENIVNAVVAKGTQHNLVCDFWSQQVAQTQFNNKKFDVLLAQNVFAHVDDCHEFMKAANLVMHDDAMLYIQTSQCFMVQHNEFDTIYHEHLSFFSVLSMKTMAEANGFFLNDVYISDIHGQSFLFIMSKRNKPQSVIQALEKEKNDGIYKLDTYVEYAKKCIKVVDDLKATLAHYQSQGFQIVGYGAAAKGMTLLNFGPINHTQIDYIVDDAPLKQGLFTPGSNIPIVNSERLKNESRDKILIIPLAWNFFEEIRSKVEKLLAGQNKQVKFVKYFPSIDVIEAKQSSSSLRLSSLPAGCNLSSSSFNDSRGIVIRADCPDALNQYKSAPSPYGTFHQVLVVHNNDMVMRGMHYAHYSKSVTVISGAIFDIIIDLRRDSPTYGHYYGVELKVENNVPVTFQFPAHFAHGYISRGPSTVVYGIASSVANAQEIRFSMFDPHFNLPWNITPEERANMKLNAADANSQPFASAEQQILARQSIATKPLIMIVGARGFIGSLLVDFLQTHSFQVLTREQVSTFRSGSESSTAKGYVYCSDIRVNSLAVIEKELSYVQPTHIINAAGRTKGPPSSIQNIDYLQQSDATDTNVRDNLYSAVSLGQYAQQHNIHYTYLGTSGMYNYVEDGVHTPNNHEWKGFKEDDEPNFTGNNYSIVKQWCDRMLNDLHVSSGAASKILNLRIAMPITGGRNQRSLLIKLLSFKALNAPLYPNSITVLPTLFPVLLDMLLHGVSGTFNFTNPGALSHDDILSIYKRVVDSNISWNINQPTGSANPNAIPKSSHKLDTSKLQALYPNIPTLQQAIEQVCNDIKAQDKSA